MENVESAVKIYFSNRYGDFSWMKGNRDLDKIKIKKIKQAILEEDTDILKYAPIIVDSNMKIIDGQHRFTVAKELGRPVHYVVVDKMDLAQVAKINSNSSSWRVKDYLASFIDMGKAPYAKIFELTENYGGTSLTIASLLTTMRVKTTNMRELFCQGEVTTKHLDFTINLLNQAKRYTGHIVNPYSNSFLDALIKLNAGGLFNDDEMLRKLEQTTRQIDNLTSAKTIIQNMEEIMNINAKKRVIIFQ